LVSDAGDGKLVNLFLRCEPQCLHSLKRPQKEETLVQVWGSVEVPVILCGCCSDLADSQVNQNLTKVPSSQCSVVQFILIDDLY
jgi:hypothetical protein